MQARAPINHIIILDGTQSRLDDGFETNAGLLYKLLKESQPQAQSKLWYQAGIQGHGLWNWVTIASGLGINRIIRNAYAQLCAKYQKGDKIYLFGFSRGAYAVRSLTGLIKEIGLVRREEASARHIRKAFALYENKAPKYARKSFCETYCETDVEIEMVGIWDTVKALGLPYPILTRLAPMATDFHNDAISNPVKNGFHALALDETRQAYAPVMWQLDSDWIGNLEQVWFRGAHSDIGGHVWKYPAARPLSNIPLVWMLEKVEKCGLALPENWKDRFPCDPEAPMIGCWRGIARFFLIRQRRAVGQSPHEALHSSVKQRS